MSIWGSHQEIGWHPGGMSIYNDGSEEHRPGRFELGEVRAYADGWSNHYPTSDVETPASVAVADIPVWCVPGHREEIGDDPGPWLQLSVNAPDAVSWSKKDEAGSPTPDPRFADVVMNDVAVESLRDQLTAWLDRPKVYPIATATPRSSDD